MTAATKTRRKSEIETPQDEATIEAANATPDADLPSDDATAEAKTPRWTPMDADRAAWVAANARPAVSTCLCGCGGTTKGRFVPGHDATLKEALKATIANGDEAAQESANAALATFGW